MSNSVRENRARRAAARQGLHLVKSKTRDPRALGYGRWWLAKAGEVPVLDLDYSSALDDVEAFLAGQLPGFELVRTWDELAERPGSFLGSVLAAGAGTTIAYQLTGGRIGTFSDEAGRLDVYPDRKAFAAEWEGEQLAADVDIALGVEGTVAR